MHAVTALVILLFCFLLFHFMQSAGCKLDASFESLLAQNGKKIEREIEITFISFITSKARLFVKIAFLVE